MSAEIDMSNGRANIAYVGETPWHGLGSNLTPDATIDDWIREAGLGFGVRRGKVWFQHGPMMIPVENRIALYRDDTNAPLGVVSNRYHEIQPREALEFFREYTEAGEMHLEVAGALNGGRRIWALARNGREIRIKGQDLVRPYLLLSTSYDGTTATVASFTTVRVVCMNTLSFAFGQMENDRRSQVRSFVSVPHRKVFNASEVKAELQAFRDGAEQFEERANKLADIQVDDETAVRYFIALAGRFNKDRELTTQSAKRVARLVELYKRGPGADLRSAQGTAWGLVNAVTRFVDHEAGQRREGSRLESAWFGEGRVLKERAEERALALAA